MMPSGRSPGRNKPLSSPNKPRTLNSTHRTQTELVLSLSEISWLLALNDHCYPHQKHADPDTLPDLRAVAAGLGFRLFGCLGLRYTSCSGPRGSVSGLGL